MSGIIKATNLEVTTIKDKTNSNTALTVNSNGTMTPSQMVYASFTITSAQHSGTAAGYETVTNWVSLPAPHTTLGASMTHSSGTFTFPHTGKYRVTFICAGYASGGNRGYAGGQIKYSSNSGGSYSNLIRCINNAHADSAYFQGNATVLIEITNTSTQSIRFNSYTSGNIVLTYNDNSTMCIFEQVG